MLRRWAILLAMLGLTVGMAVTAGSASAGTTAGTFNPGGLIHFASGASPHGTGVSHVTSTTSTNWSGYAATSGTYTSVSASWTQPKGTCTSGDQYAAFWVGLDGYSSSTVEQTGSEVDCVGRTAEYYAWYEMYPGPSENYSNTVKAGDHFNSTVTFEGGKKFSLYIADTTQGWSHTTTASLTSTPGLSSAEVIVEAPCCTNSGGILPLTNFGTVSLTNSTANGSAIGSAAGLYSIDMVDSSGRTQDTVTSLSGGENFGATWVRSN